MDRQSEDYITTRHGASTYKKQVASEPLISDLLAAAFPYIPALALIAIYAINTKQIEYWIVTSLPFIRPLYSDFQWFLIDLGLGKLPLLFIQGMIFLGWWILDDKITGALMGARLIRTQKEAALLMDIYRAVRRVDKKVRIMILDSRIPNAYAFGSKTIVVTRMAMEIFSKEELFGIIFHELGHLRNKDTFISVLLGIARMPVTILLWVMKIIGDFLLRVSDRKGAGFLIVALAYLMLIPRAIFLKVESIILWLYRRLSEYHADQFAFTEGYGEGLVKALYTLDSMQFDKPEQLLLFLERTHPPLTKRIRVLEHLLAGK